MVESVRAKKLPYYAACILVACALAVGALALLTADPASGRARYVTMVGAGDIADCNSKRDEATAKLLGRVRGTVFTLGDNVQDRGKAHEFRNCYKPSWGKYKNRTKPSVGNHEYYTSDRLSVPLADEGYPAAGMHIRGHKRRSGQNNRFRDS